MAAIALSGALGCSAEPAPSEAPGTTTQAASVLDCNTYQGTQQRRAECVEYLFDRTALAPSLLGGVPPEPEHGVTYRHGVALSSTEFAAALLATVRGSAMFPGAMLRAQRAVLGVMDQPLFSSPDQNNGGRVVVSGVTLIPGASSFTDADAFNLGSVQDAIQEVLDSGQATFTPNTSVRLSETSKSESLLVGAKISLSAAVKVLNLTSDGAFDIQNSSSTTDIVAHFIQDFYSASVSQPNSAATGGFFTDKVTPDDIRSARINEYQPMAYVSRVNYGREILANFKSSHSSKEVNAALSSALTIISEKLGLSLDQKLSVSSKKVLDETTVTAWSIGDISPVAMTAYEFLNAVLNKYPATVTALTPISYVVNHFETNEVLATKRVTDFHVVTTVSHAKQKIRMRHGGVKFHDSGDTAGQGDLTGSTWITETIGGASTELFRPSWTRRKTADGSTFAESGTYTRDVLLELSPRYKFGYNFTDENWNALRFSWRNEENINGETFLEFNGRVWTGNFFNANGSVNTARSSQGDLDGEMATNSFEFVDECGVGYGWSPWQKGCVKKTFSVNNNVDYGYSEVCGLDEIIVNTDVVYATSKHLSPTQETYTVLAQEMSGDYPNLSANGAAPFSVTANLQAPPTTMPKNGFVLQHVFAPKTNVVYRVVLTGNQAGSFGERHIKVKPAGVESTIDGRRDASLYLASDAPLNAELIEACGRGSKYWVSIQRERSGSWQTIVSSVELDRAMKGFSIRGFVRDFGVAGVDILPGERWKLTISVLGAGSALTSYEKVIELAGCPSGSAWMGDACYNLHPTSLRSASSGSCAAPVDVGSGVSYLAAQACNGSLGFSLVDFGNNHVGLRTADHRCVDRSQFVNGAISLRPCDGSLAQSFFQHEGNGFVRLEANGGQCLSFSSGYLALNSCELTNTSNRLKFVWTPDPVATTTAWQTALMYGTSSISDGSQYGALIRDWDAGYFKSTCADATHAMTGLSYFTNTRVAHRQLCVNALSSGAEAAVLRGTHDNRRASRSGDWSPGSYKWECGANEFVSGVSQDNSGAVHAARCVRGLGSTSACELRQPLTYDDRGTVASSDWDPHYYKAECSTGKVVVGLSVNPATRKVDKLMCCNQ